MGVVVASRFPVQSAIVMIATTTMFVYSLRMRYADMLGELADMLRELPLEDVQPIEDAQPIENVQPIIRQVYLPEWRRIQITQRMFQNFCILTQNRFRQRVKKYICFITYQIMRQPSTMRFCQVRAQKVVLKAYIRSRQRCLNCHRQADLSFIEQDEQLANEILIFRLKVLKTYRMIPLNQRPHWKQLIDSQFGEGYTEEHLQ